MQQKHQRTKLLAAVRAIVSRRPTLSAHLRALRKPFYVTLFWLSMLELTKLVQELPYKLLIDNLNRLESVWFAVGLCGLYFLAELTMRGVFVIADTWRINFIEHFSIMLFDEGHRKELELSMDWHNKHGTGEKEAIIAKNIEKVKNLADSAVFEAIPTALLIFFTSLAVFALGWQYGAIAIATLALYVCFQVMLEPKLAPMRKEYHDEVKAIETFGSEITQNCRTIKSFGLEEHFLGRLGSLLGTFINHEIPRHRRWLLTLSLPEALLSGSRFAVQVAGVYLMYKRQMNLSSFVLAVTWMSKVFSNYNRLTRFQHQLHRGLSAAEELVQIFETPPSVQPPLRPVWPRQPLGRIELRDVSFRYPEQKDCALKDINLTIEPNQVVAVIGKSGSGKTTLANLLVRTDDPSSGQILVDGVDLRSIDYARFRSEFCASVHQNAALFNTTVRENIRLGHTGAEPGAELLAAELAYADEFIERFPDSYETLVGENGVRLSGGQKQRLCIARALVRNAKLLVLDEPTSALDGESQQKVKTALARLTSSRRSTIVIIAHRFSTIEMADVIVVMDQGEIVEIGSHEELQRQNGFYARLRQLETEGALGEEDDFCAANA